MDRTNNEHSQTSRGEPLEEYKEALAYMRHDDQIAWTILGLSTTISFGVWAYTFKDIPVWSRRGLVLSFLGVLVFALGRLMAHNVSGRTSWRRQRAQELEAHLGFELLTRQPPPRRLGVNRTLTTIAISAFVVWFVYLVVFLVHAR